METPRAQFIEPARLSLNGSPNATALAECLARLADDAGATLILLDGPQAWKDPASTDKHMRACERSTRTPGRTGLPGEVKPASWTRMARFSVAVFDVLEDLGWPRFELGWNGDKRAIESFPTQAWRTLGLSPLPGKARRDTNVSDWSKRLRERTGLRSERRPSHDELQAAVAGLAGLQLLASGDQDCELAGTAPFLFDGHWREGFIVSPRWSPA